MNDNDGLVPVQAKVGRIGPLPLKALQSDNRFSYCGYVPEGFNTNPDAYRLLLAFHGSDRNALELSRLFQELSETAKFVVVCPLFAGGVAQPDNMDGYKFLYEYGLNYALVIDRIIAEVEQDLGSSFGRICLFGISGGAQCAHRYAIVRPGRLEAVSLVAPGVITIPGADLPWWEGTQDLEAVFGTAFVADRFRKIRFQLLVGARDTDDGDILPNRKSRYRRRNADYGGSNRIERLDHLRRALTRMNVSVDFEIVPAAGHELEPMIGRVFRFLRDVAVANPVALPGEPIFI